jgi:glycosyltransferase involved in cell wall biosynthesis
VRILLLSRWFPYPADNGSKIRVFNLAKQLARWHEVHLHTFYDADQPPQADHVVALRRVCETVSAYPHRKYQPGRLSAMIGLLSSKPRFLVDTHSRELSAVIARQAVTSQFDAVVASEIDMLPYALEMPGVKAILDELQVAVIRDRCIGQKGILAGRAWLTWLKFRGYLRATLPRLEMCVVASERERQLVAEVAHGRATIEVIPNAVDVAEYRGQFGAVKPNTIVYAGAVTFGANYDAVEFFVENIFPMIRARVPEVRLLVTGAHTGVDLRHLGKHPQVEFTGYVADVRPIVAQSAVSVVPLRIGGGTRLKILESMALGTPVVATRKGAEGLNVVDGKDICLADGPQVFADKTVELLTSAATRAHYSAAGRRLVEAQYDWAVVGQRFSKLLVEVAARRST